MKKFFMIIAASIIFTGCSAYESRGDLEDHINALESENYDGQRCIDELIDMAESNASNVDDAYSVLEDVYYEWPEYNELFSAVDEALYYLYGGPQSFAEPYACQRYF